ncbi:hypothetical protein F5B17DRAFT_452483 [Nemania serpens]|nr:hypothetical protein F5B17DRAFT_452483 [Nemania serpens]
MANGLVPAAYDVTFEGNLYENAQVSFKVRANIATRLSCRPLQLVCIRAQGVMTYEALRSLVRGHTPDRIGKSTDRQCYTLYPNPPPTNNNSNDDNDDYSKQTGPTSLKGKSLATRPSGSHSSSLPFFLDCTSWGESFNAATQRRNADDLTRWNASPSKKPRLPHLSRLPPTAITAIKAITATTTTPHLPVPTDRRYRRDRLRRTRRINA